MEPTAKQLEILKKLELDMLKAFIDVCNELNLRYYLLGGTLLGAIRHQGFIPWDDDIDVGMPRLDYEIFLKKGQELLPNNLFLQNIYTDPEYLMCFSKIRNSDTAFIETSVSHLKINHGVFIDVFPLDYYPENAIDQKKIDLKKELYSRRINYCFNNSSNKKTKHKIAKIIFKFMFPSLKKVMIKRDSLYKSLSQSTLVANYGGAWGKKEIVPSAWYGDGVKVMFEGVEVNAPSEYHNWLTQVYGDYMTPPPVEKQVGHHFVDIIDLNNSYTKYMEER